jgi:predicted O-methyltransferase YrrM
MTETPRHGLDPTHVRAQLGSLVRRATIRLAKSALPLVYRDSPVPFDVVLGLRKFGGRPEIMSLRGAVRTGRVLENEFLAHRLADTVFGQWTAAAQALNLIEQKIYQSQPTLVLEFGSGVSTSCLAQYMREVHGSVNRTFVITVEEDSNRREETYARAASLGLAKHVSLVHAPLKRQMLKGRETICYQLTGELRSLLVHQPPEFVFIDGPGPTQDRLSRYGTLPLCQEFVAPGSSFYLDDALRDRELEAGRLWSAIPGISVQGLFFVGHGLLTGRIGGSKLWS